ncbi:MAG TPA: hypothetical protein VKU02_26785 [Gemmataceae bacterium]|nr:hypothetical protein [Gemmataceae bacterium]
MGIGNGTNGNGNGRLVIVLAGIFLPPVLAALVGGIATYNSRLTQHTEKIAVLESQVRDIRDDLQRINTKIDKLLERRP